MKSQMQVLRVFCVLSVACAENAVGPKSPPSATPIHGGASAGSRIEEPQVQTLDGGRVIVLRGEAVDTAVGTLRAFYSAAGESVPRTPDGQPQATRKVSPSLPHFELIAGEQVTEDMFPTASIGAHSTVPSLNVGGTAASILSSANYTGSNAHLDMLWGANRDDNGIEKPQTGTPADDDAFWDCVGAILSTPGLFDFSVKCNASGTVKQQVLYTTSTSCGVHVYGSANYQAWYWAPLPDPSGSLTNTGGGVSVHFSMAKIHPSPVVGDPQAEAYNGPCADQGPTDVYQPGGTGGSSESSCPLEDTYMWYHDYQDGRGLIYVGDVCVQNGIVTILDRSPAHRIGVSQPAVDAVPASQNDAMAGQQVTVALVTDMPPNENARVLRNGETQIITVNSASTPEDLTLAVGTLGLLRALGVAQAAVDITPSHRGALFNASASPLIHAMAGHLSDLHVAAPTVVPGIGNAPAIELPLPGQARMRN